MTGEELKNMLITINQSLQTNKQLVDPRLVDALRKFINGLRNHPAVAQEAPGDFSLDKLWDGLFNALDIEMKLIGKEGETMMKVCSCLEHRTMLLAMVARFM